MAVGEDFQRHGRVAVAEELDAATRRVEGGDFKRSLRRVRRRTSRSRVALPTGPAAEPFEHLTGPNCSSVVFEHVGKPVVCSFVPLGRKKLMPISGGGEPSYSVPEILYSACTAAPAPRMLPVCGKPGIGTASALKVTVGDADATAGSASRARPRATRQVDALRIRFSSSFRMGRPFAVPMQWDRSVGPTPCRDLQHVNFRLVARGHDRGDAIGAWLDSSGARRAAE